MTTTPEASWLTALERADLQAHEVTLDRGAQSDVERGRALLDIRNRRLYRQSHGTFEAFCAQPRWKLSRKRAYDLIALAEVCDVVSTMGDTPNPANERVARELAPLLPQPERLREAWQEAIEQHEGDAPTATVVREVVRGDLRWTAIEDAADSFAANFPNMARVVWPTEQGDWDGLDDAFSTLTASLPRLRREWRAYKKQARAERAQHGLRAVA